MGRASVPTPALYPAFFFVLGKAAKAQETQSSQRFQHVDHTAFNTSGTNGPRSLFRMKAGTHSPSPAGAHTAAHRAKQGRFSEECREPAGQRCAYARRCSTGVAAPLGCVIPLLFLSPHRWASRFCSAASLAHRKLSTCSLVTAVCFWDRCLRRSMRGTCLSERRSDCRF